MKSEKAGKPTGRAPVKRVYLGYTTKFVVACEILKLDNSHPVLELDPPVICKGNDLIRV